MCTERIKWRRFGLRRLGKSRGPWCHRRLGIFVLPWILSLVQAAWAQNELGVPDYSMSNYDYGLQVGPYSNPSLESQRVFYHSIRFADAAWMRVQLLNVVLNRGDEIRLRGLGSGLEQVIRWNDPQFADPSFTGVFTSIIFDGGLLDVSLTLANGSTDAKFEIAHILIAYGPIGDQRTICGLTDDRQPMDDACAVRIVAANGQWASGFMISDTWMLTANHVITALGIPTAAAPYTVQRNVRPSNAQGVIQPPAAANDQFTVSNLNNSTRSNTDADGNDWAVVNVPNNADGAPGAGCRPAFDCNLLNQDNTVSVDVRGFGVSTIRVRNGVLQVNSGITGPTQKSPARNSNFFRYAVDTRNRNSGSRVARFHPANTDRRIVGIHTDGGCNRTSPEGGRNGGTLISNPNLTAAILARCGDNICPTGACCYTNGTCVIRTRAACVQSGGTYRGDGTGCPLSRELCVGDPNGACCFPDATCLTMVGAECAAAGGSFEGDGNACETANCTSALGACCSGGTCDIVPAAECLTVGGAFLGGGTDCVEADCELGACCLEFGGCDVLSREECESLEGSFAGAGSSCDSDDVCTDAVPTVSAWGLVVLSLVLLTGAKITFGRRMVGA